mmetsp:Transcript_69471/g.180996  ORF Transcript_69471/g.180996 Transcript_69471/m.180996 type:complete len:264 (+) Transcript_69471:1021-1812(+)
MQAGWWLPRLPQTWLPLKTISMDSYGTTTNDSESYSCFQGEMGKLVRSVMLFRSSCRFIPWRLAVSFFHAFLPSGVRRSYLAGRDFHLSSILFLVLSPRVWSPAQRSLKWNFAPVVDSQKVTVPLKDSRVITHAWSLPPCTVPLQTKAFLPSPSSAQHSSTAWSCTVPRRSDRTSSGFCQSLISPLDRCRGRVWNSTHRTQWQTVIGLASVAGSAKGWISFGSGLNSPAVGLKHLWKRRLPLESGNQTTYASRKLAQALSHLS